MVRGRAINSPRLQEKKRRDRRVMWLAIAAIALSTIYLFTRLLSANFLQITHIEVKGTTTLDPAVITSFALSELDGTYIHLVPHSSTFWYPAKRMSANIKKEFPSINTLEMSHDGMSTLAITVNEYQPEALWCEGEFLYHTFGETPCYYLTNDGYVYGRAAARDDKLYVRYYGMSTSSLPLRSQFLSRDEFHTYDDFVTGMIRLKLPVLGVTITPSGDNEMYILTSVATSTDFAIIYFNNRTPLAKTLDTLVQFISSKRSELLRQGTTTLDYIDARYGTTIFSKMK